MNRLVFLYELDSVRNSDKEIEIGQNALFEEIVKNGNSVVLTFNQLTDSTAFLEAVKNPDTYEYIIRLFKSGALKVSQFGKTRTASQFLQNSIEKILAKNDEGFIFSGIPVLFTEKELLKTMQTALKNCDLGLLIDEVNNAKDDNEKKRLIYITKFIHMILVLSIDETAINPAKNKVTSFLEIYNKIITFLQDKNSGKIFTSFGGSEIYKNISQAVQLAEDTKEKLISAEKDGKKPVNERSKWHESFSSAEITDITRLSEAIIDICYNYTLEDSISDVLKHYDGEIGDISFFEDFVQRLIHYTNEYRTGIHEFCKGDKNKIREYKGILPPWDTAVRIAENEEKHRNKNTSHEIKIYEKEIKKSRAKWNKRLILQMLSRLGIALFYILIFCTADYIIGFLEDLAVNFYSHIELSEFALEMMNILCSTILFGILSSVVANIFRLPDILDSINNIITGFKDTYRIIRTKRRISYKIIKE